MKCEGIFFNHQGVNENKQIGITYIARNIKFNKHIHTSININIFHKSYKY